MNNKSPFGLLARLEIESLLKKINYNTKQDYKDLNPSTNTVVYDSLNFDDLLQDGFNPTALGSRERILKTDFGYAILDVEELRDWMRLQFIIADPLRAKAFIDKVANTPGSFPNGITKEAAEWLRWSVFAQTESQRKALNNLGNAELQPRNRLLDIAINFFHEKRIEFRKLMRQKEVLLFPFGNNARLEVYEIAEKDGQIVLEILARHFILSRLFVKRTNGEYAKLSEFLDRDSLMLLSRFPELLPSYPVFEGGQFSINYVFTRIGSDDVYTVGKRSISPLAQTDEIKYQVDFIANAQGSFDDEQLLEQQAFFRISFSDDEDFEDEDYHKIFSSEAESMDHFLIIKTRQFFEATGYSLPVSSVIDSDESEYNSREFIVTFGNAKIPPYILNAFYVFASLN